MVSEMSPAKPGFISGETALHVVARGLVPLADNGLGGMCSPRGTWIARNNVQRDPSLGKARVPRGFPS
jgi:hypothetical protein